MKTGVLFGVFREVRQLTERFGTEDVAFCFDLGKPKRKELFHGYKMKRHSSTDPVDLDKRRQVREQLALLRNTLLDEIGYHNVFAADGYEADDVIASLVQHMDLEDRAIIVSDDKDLWQLISKRVVVYRPRMKVTLDLNGFMSETGIAPSGWAKVKAIAGCETDEVNGLKGCREKTACKFLANLPLHHVTMYNKIKQYMGTEEYARNLQLIHLPYPGTPAVKAVPHVQIKDTAWDAVMARFGMASLMRRAATASVPYQRRTV